LALTLQKLRRQHADDARFSSMTRLLLLTIVLDLINNFIRRPRVATPDFVNPAVEIKLDRTKRVLAAEMGTTSETLSRTLAKFRDQNLLRVKGNIITLTNPRGLQKLLQRNLGEL
jgi:CRP-like cAMP-binding protein